MKSTLPRRAALAVLLTATFAPGAQAHAILMESTPAIGGQVRAGTLALRLRFNSRIDAARSRVALVRQDKSQQVLAIEGSNEGDVLTAVVTLRPGAYALRWQVLAIDGHITRGEIPFTVDG